MDESSKSYRCSSVWLAGFFLLGMLLGMPGSLVINWQYHIDAEPQLIGLHFLAMSVGYIVSAQVVKKLLRVVALRRIGIACSGLACFSLVALALLAPPAPAWCRIISLAFSGIAAGGLITALFYANEPLFAEAPANAANRAGALFVGGSLLATIVNGSTYFGGSVQLQTFMLACVPAIFFFLYLFNRFALAQHPTRVLREDTLRDTLKDLRSVATVLFALLVFFQFGIEWALGGWLPLYLIRIMGINPVTAVWALASYFLALMIGRIIAQFLLPIVNHKKLLLLSVGAAMVGYLLLSLTASTTLAFIAVFIVGAGHAPIYPLITERLDDRFSYHPGFYSGVISIAIAGAMTTPWLLGYVDSYLGMRFVMLIPAFGSVAVLILSVLIMLEARLMGGKRNDSSEVLLA
jgi:fucose permease